MQPSDPNDRASCLRRIAYCLLPVCVGAGAAFVLLLVASRPARPAYAANLTYPGCAATIQGCIDGASTGDTILISAGNYTESLTLSKAVSLTGALSSTTILHALPNTRVLTVTSPAVDSSVVISGLTFTGGLVTGTASCPQSCGGGILITNQAQPLLVNSMLTNNAAGYRGGGLYDDTGLTMLHVQFIGNMGGGAFTGGDTTVQGGLFQGNQSGRGLFANGALSLIDTEFISNTGGGAYTASPTTVQGGLFQGNQSSDGGGGLWVVNSLVLTDTQFIHNTSAVGGGAFAFRATVSNSRFERNQCTANNCDGGALHVSDALTLTGTDFVSNTAIDGGAVFASGAFTLNGGLFQANTAAIGGGLYAFSTLAVTGTQFVSNTASNEGGGVLAQASATVQGGLFQGNQCAGISNCFGGGLAANANLAVTNTQFLSNTSTGSGGGASAGVFAPYGNVTLNGGLFQNNQCTGAGCVGGGLFASQDVAMTNTQFLSNTSTDQGGGLYAVGNLTATNTQFLSNTSSIGGGASANEVCQVNNVTLNGGLFQNNQATSGPGGGLIGGGDMVLSGTQFLSNTSTSQGGGLYACATLTVTNTQFLSNRGQQGAGLYHYSGPGRLVNDLFAANQASDGGAALYLASPGSVAILFTTIASPTLGSGAAIVVANGTVGITDTIIASYTTGISQTAGSVFQDYNLFFGNGTNTTGTVSGGAHSFTGNPRFVNPAGGDYHLGSGSLAIDAGTDAGVTTDFEGDPRPLGAGFDIGFDESTANALVDVGVTKSASAVVRQPGQTLTYTLVYSNAGPNIAAGVRLTDMVPANLIAVSYTSSGAALTPVGLSPYAWQVANLAPGTGGIVTVTGVLSGGLHGTVFTNTATITSAYSDTNPANNTSAVSATVANVPPVAADDAYTLSVNSTLTVTAPGVLGNDTDANNDPLTAVLAAGPLTGTLNLHADGSFTYTPPLGYSGVVTFTYRANDGLADSNTPTVTLTVTPIANLGLVKSANSSLLAPGQRLTYTLVFSNAGPSLAAGVRLTDIVPANLVAITYTSSGAALTPVGLNQYVWQVANLAPGAGGVITVTGVLATRTRGTVFTNTATITSAYSDTNPANNTSAVSVTVANVPPVAADDAYTMTGNTTLTVTAPGVLANDTDANNDPVMANLAAGPLTGTLSLHADGSFTYTPPIGYSGVVTFTYRANDGLADSNTATVTITVTAATYKLYLPLVMKP